MLLVIEPCPLVFFPVGKNKQAFAITLTLKVKALIDIAVGELCASFTIGFVVRHVPCIYATVLEGIASHL